MCVCIECVCCVLSLLVCEYLFVCVCVGIPVGAFECTCVFVLVCLRVCVRVLCVRESVSVHECVLGACVEGVRTPV